jgi:hypothetical protein
MQVSDQVLEKLEMHMAKICSEYTRGLDRHRQACLTSYNGILLFNFKMCIVFFNHDMFFNRKASKHIPMFNGQ